MTVFNTPTQFLFGRSYAVAIGIGKPGSTTMAWQYGNIPVQTLQVPFANKFTSQPPAPLRVQFDIMKNTLATSNKAEIKIFNMSNQNSAALTPGVPLRLQAGYNNVVNTIFYGVVLLEGASTKRSGPDIITTIPCGDGESAITYTRLDRSYPPGTTLASILQDVANQMSIATEYSPVGVQTGLVMGLPNVTYGRGIIVHGTCSQTLTKLLKPHNMIWSVQNGLLQIMPKNAYSGNGTAIVVSQDTGMIGVPSNNNSYTQFTSLLNPQIVPGCLVQLQTNQKTTVNGKVKSLSGFYIVQTAHYEGDSHDNKWQVTCECTAAPNVRQALPVATGSDFSKAVIA